MLASPTRRWSAGAVLLTLLVLAASWFLLISPRRADATSVREQALSKQNQAQVLQQQITRLKSQFSQLPARQAELAAIKKQLPSSADVPALVRSLQEYAAAAGVSLDSLAPGTPSIVSASGSAGPAKAAAPGEVVALPISLAVSGDYFEDALFIKALQTKLDRAFLITALSSSQGGAQPVMAATAESAGSTPAAVPAADAVPDLTSMQISGSVYVLLDDTTTLEDVADQARQSAAGVKLGATQGSTAAATADAR